MKNKLLYLQIVLLTFILLQTGCNTDKGGFVDSKPVLGHRMWTLFVDESGRNLADDLLMTNESDGTTVIDRKKITVDIFLNGKIVVKNNPHSVHQIQNIEYGEENLIDLYASDLGYKLYAEDGYAKGKSMMVEFRIVSFVLFGDNAQHSIFAEWKLEELQDVSLDKGSAEIVRRDPRDRVIITINK